MSDEEIKDEFINCIEGSHTLNLAISVLEDRKELQEKLDKYYNPDDMTLMYMLCDVKAKDEIERLNNIIKEAIEILEDYEKENIGQTIPCIIDIVKEVLKDSDKE